MKFVETCLWNFFSRETYLYDPGVEQDVQKDSILLSITEKELFDLADILPAAGVTDELGRHVSGDPGVDIVVVANFLGIEGELLLVGGVVEVVAVADAVAAIAHHVHASF